VIVDSSIFTGGGTMAHDASVGELRNRPVALLHPVTAAQMTLPLERGDVIELTGPGGARLGGLMVLIDEGVPEGAVVLIDGIPEAPVNALGGVPGVTVSSKRSARELLGAQA